jgi:hypothetical protein
VQLVAVDAEIILVICHKWVAVGDGFVGKTIGLNSEKYPILATHDVL